MITLSSIYLNSSSISKLLLLLGVICGMSSTLLYDILLKDCGGYYLLNSLSFSFYVGSNFVMSSSGHVNRFSGFWRWLSIFSFLCSLGSVYEELTGQATMLNWNDLIRYVVVIYISTKLTNNV